MKAMHSRSPPVSQFLVFACPTNRHGYFLAIFLGHIRRQIGVHPLAPPPPSLCIFPLRPTCPPYSFFLVLLLPCFTSSCFLDFSSFLPLVLFLPLCSFPSPLFSYPLSSFSLVPHPACPSPSLVLFSLVPHPSCPPPSLVLLLSLFFSFPLVLLYPVLFP